MRPLLTAAQMRESDRCALQRLGVPGAVLMENAGRGVVAAIARANPRRAGADVRVVCGAGQNGGDGFVIARHLANRGARVQVLLAAPPARGARAAAVFLAAAERTPGVTLGDHGADADAEAWRARLAGAQVLVDAVFGTGLR